MICSRNMCLLLLFQMLDCYAEPLNLSSLFRNDLGLLLAFDSVLLNLFLIVTQILKIFLPLQTTYAGFLVGTFII